jgi:cytochrome P450
MVSSMPTATLDALEDDPYPLLARLRASEPVAWLEVLGGWLVTRRDLALAVMRDAETFTVDDPRFSTAQVVGPSMLSLDGAEHRRHREPFADPFRRAAVRERLTAAVAAEADRLIDALAPAGAGELRRGFAGPLAAATMARALGVPEADTAALLEAYDAIVAAVDDISAGRPRDGAGEAAFGRLAAILGAARADSTPAGGGATPPTGSLLAAAGAAIGRGPALSNAAVLLFGGIETTEGMIANALVHLLGHPGQLALVRADPGLLANALEESLRLEPAAAAVDRYATADTELAGARIARGDLVRVSISAANRDPAVFADPDRFDVHRANARRHIAFAHGPHVCLGMHLARLEALVALEKLLARLPGLELDGPPPQPRGLIFRKPPAVPARWRMRA